MSIIQSEVFEPYAQALMSLAQEHNLTEEIGEDMRGILNLLKESPDLAQFIGSPIIKESDKKNALGQILGDSVQPFTRNFLMLLIDRRRIPFIEGIANYYLMLLRKLNQTVLAEVTSAVPLNEAQQEGVRNKVKEITSAQQVELETKIDADLIGGVVIKVGSQVLDASLRGQLRRIGVRLGSNS
ncbi:ATP synthase F1 subunit delta [Laspinema olomoucense]|uniref:ATP synthase subunit delta n=1 Tax=Laspinema olomoucense D3b TaxID=2953688 RepID=A0ABT2N875_9CYAN|nr:MULTISPECIES: ATP synthase F1 subunit delta [unclassified Laspinema]MCT7973823.1 ATP synthase F1 subunit delta [Laspinema sp. D3d]MCT7978909.1 ATP synthase F1 subunit delta [Laspinema sp. D3b]MCT7988460.1 ATP synthase F1 subunit delta [Laspinema sp. D3a]MCT7996301.1 ATP synthase F1 subunit delta [Laspinema sp. D3c]